MKTLRLFSVLMVTLLLAACATSQRNVVETNPVALQNKAIEEVLEAFRSEDPFLRANAIEAMRPIRSRVEPLVTLGLEDDAAPVRFAALMTIGDLQLTGLRDRAEAMQLDANGSVRVAAIYATHQCGGRANISDLDNLARSIDPGVRGNAYNVLSRLGGQGVLAMLRELDGVPFPEANSTTEQIMRLQIAEAMVQLGDREMLSVIRAGMFSQDPEVQVLATTMAGDLGDFEYESALLSMVDEPRDDLPELAIAAAVSLAKMGDAAGQRTLLDASRQRTVRWQGQTADAAPIRAQAAFGLGHLDTPQANNRLAELLEDESPGVRIAAASQILAKLGESISSR